MARERANSRYNLGVELGAGGERTVNVPTLCRLFLQPENQRRLSFEKKGTRSFDGLRTIEVRFVEETSPTLIHDSWHNDVPARGRFWIDPSRGIVVRTEVEYDLQPETRDRRDEGPSLAEEAGAKDRRQHPEERENDEDDGPDDA